MGYNTAMMVCNDSIHELENDPLAGKKIARGIREADFHPPHSVGIGSHCNSVMILPSQHADTSQLVVVGGNYIRPVHAFHNRMLAGVPDDEIAELVLKRLAEELGYNLVRKAWRKRQDARP